MSVVQTYRDGVRALGSAQKPPAVVPAYLRWVNRPLGRRAAAAAHVAGLSPDQVTAASAGLGVLGVVVLAVGAPSAATGLVASAALLASYVLDSADGQLARLRGGGSPAGEWLDHVVDIAKTTALLLAVLVQLHRSGSADGAAEAWLLVPMAALVATSTLTFATMLRDQLVPAPAPARAGGGRLRSLALLPVDHGALCLVVATVGAPDLFRWSLLALTGLLTAFTVRLLVRTRRALLTL